jgi:hypothetical protein
MLSTVRADDIFAFLIAAFYEFAKAGRAGERKTDKNEFPHQIFHSFLSLCPVVSTRTNSLTHHPSPHHKF